MEKEPQYSLELDKTKDTKTWQPCEKCAGTTEHIVLCSAEMSRYFPGPEFHFTENREIIQCQGCKEISFRKVTSNSEDYPYENENIYPIDI